VILVDEFLAIRVIAGSAPEPLRGEPAALTYGRAYRLTRALLGSGPGRLQVRGRFTRLVDALGEDDQRAINEWLADPDPAVLTIIDPRAYISSAAALQNTFSVSLLQAETLAVGAEHDWPISFGDPDSGTERGRFRGRDRGAGGGQFRRCGRARGRRRPG
jgi:hypothetical protein